MARLNIDLVVEDKGSKVIADFDRKVESSMDGAGGAVGDFAKGLEGAFGGIAGMAAAIPAGMAAATAAIVTLVATSATQARELENMARVAGMGVAEFQELSFATEKFGLSAEKMADMSKDVQDKIGDFIATGAGEFADFFENVAPKIGVTAQQLAKLSGPDALIAIKKGMDDANVSAAEQVFYLEAIANDASLLIPLLANNGEALKKNAERARDLGLSLSEFDHQSLLDAKDATDDITAAFGGLKNHLAAEFAPAYTEIVGRAAELIVEWGGKVIWLGERFNNILVSMVGWNDVLDGRLGFLEFASMDAKDLAAWLQDDKQLLVDIDQQMGQLVEERNNIRFSSFDKGESSRAAKAAIDEQINSLKAEKAEIEFVTAAKKELDRALATVPQGAVGGAVDDTVNQGAYGRGREALERYIETQEERIKKDYDAAVAFAKTNEERSKALARYNEQLAALEKKHASTGSKEVSAYERGRAALERYIETQDERIKKEYEAVAAFAKTDEEQARALAHYNEQLAKVSDQSTEQMFSAYQSLYGRVGTISEQMYATLLTRYERDRDDFIDIGIDKLTAYEDFAKKKLELDERAGKFEGIDLELENFFGDLDTMSDKHYETMASMESAVSGWANSFGRSLSDALWDADASFGGIAESFGRMLTEMYMQKQIVEPMLAGLFGSGGTGSGVGGFLGGALSWLGGLFGFAEGGIPGGDGLSAYRNQILTGPTMFAFASGGIPSLGVAGEAGLEGIFPVARMSSGNLGVEAKLPAAYGAPPAMEVHIHEAQGTKASVQQSNDGLSIDVLIETVENRINGRVGRGAGALGWLNQVQRGRR